MTSDFIPNSFQTPNAYVDRHMYLLTPAEWKVLTYAARRIFGFNKRQDRIAISQFMHGTISTDDGRQLDHGTGLSKPAVQEAIIGLTRYGFLIKIAGNEPKFNTGTLYELQLDSSQIDIVGLVERANQRNSTDRNRTVHARQKAREKLENRENKDAILTANEARSVPLTTSDDKSAVSPTDQARSVPLTKRGQSDCPSAVSGTDTQYPVETQEKSRGNPESDTPAPDKPAKQGVKRSKALKATDPLLQHPAVMAYRDVMHLTPNAVQRAEIADVVGDNGHVGDWRAVLHDWQLSGYKPGNVGGQLDKFKKQIGQETPVSAPSHPAAGTSPARAAMRKIIEEQGDGN